MLKTYRAVQFTLVEVRAAGVNPLDRQLRSGGVAAMMPVEFPAGTSRVPGTPAGPRFRHGISAS